MEDKNIISIVAMILIALLEIVAMINGIDGYLFSFAVAVISGLAGYKLKDFVKKK